MSMMEDSYVLQLAEQKYTDLHLCFCGYGRCEPGHSFGPAVRPNYILHFILEGKGTYQVGSTTYHLEAEQGFLIPPRVQTYYEADVREPWSYMWIGFDGKNAEEYLRDIGLGSRQLICRCSRIRELREIVMQMMEHNTCTVSDQYYLQSSLYRIFSVLAAEQAAALPHIQSGENFYVKRAISFIQNNFANPIRVTAIADYVCINRSYLYTLFRKYLGVSPQEYLTNYRITQAAELLVTTELSVATIARSCGYEDALVFSKSFKARMGVPPSVYRERELEENRKKLTTF